MRRTIGTHEWQSGDLEGADFIDFRRFVKDCAQEPDFVEYFNRACGANLQAPIALLLDDNGDRHASEDEQLMIGCFIMFVHQNIWLRLKRAVTRTGAQIKLEP